ncbi:hypothetical protein GCM10010873_30220 [Cypionkella aquatica]|uniref:DUF427 domain-containing protein n=1 Tax=Cypionkella aquatica TaxID=1756042 RepID=A0AA37TUS5_9RHOB|nr:DUF427 domain-containing protein [Cypionkella aquatica]GLS88048.1 hypothetical protein GCM10010873_30220 [Cypionkella aquatica]
MAHITITPNKTRLTITAGGMQLGMTEAALTLAEGSYPAVTYIPRADVDMQKLVKTSRQTTCPHKGVASYYTIQTPQGPLENAVWSYETPIDSVAAIAGYLAFYPDKVSLG